MASEASEAESPPTGRSGSSGAHRLTALFEQTAVGLAEVTLAGQFIRVSGRYSEIVGRSADELVRLRMQDITDPEDLPENLLLYERMLETGEPFEIEKRYVRPDGSRVWVQNNVSLIRNEQGAPVSVLAVSVDISKSKAVEEALRHNEERMGIVQAAGGIGSFDYDLQKDEAICSPEYYALLGLPVGHPINRETWQAAVHPEDRGKALDALERAVTERKPFSTEYRIIRADTGEVRWLSGRAAIIFDEQDRPWRFIGGNIDITERVLAEEALREASQRLNAIINNTKMAVFMMDDRQHCAFMNKAAEELTGYRFEETIGRPLHDVIHHKHPDGRHYPLEECPIDRAFPEDDQVQGEEVFVHKDGHFYPVAFTASPIRNDAGQPIGTIIEARGIAAEKEASEALAEQSRILETLNRTGAAVAAELDLQKVVQMVTDAGVELTGAHFGAFFYNVLNEKGESYTLYTLSGAEPSQFNFGMPRNTAVFHPTFSGEGTIRSDDITADARYGKSAPHYGMPKGHLPVRSYLAVPVISRSGEVIGGLFFGHPEPGRFTASHERLMLGLASQAAVSIDNARLYQAVQRANETLEHRVVERTTELEKAHEALRQAQKMEAIGQLTGGIAHDFNNMLTVIRGSADMLQRPDLDDAKRQRYLDAIAETSDRAARLTGQLLAFARRQALKPEVFNAQERVESIGDMLRTLLGSRIRLRIDAQCTDCLVETDAAQFETALVNMAVNARDAMEGEGELRIGIEPVDCLPPGLQPQNAEPYVAVSVTDTGHGIEPDDLQKIFEPFFTTKEVGKGTGLGLSQVYGFAKQSGGEIAVSSEPGKGATFTLYLPRSSGSEPARQGAGGQASRLPRGGRVLVVEDNEEVGRFAEQVLAELGFEARLAINADEALAILERNGEFDILFTDVVMPGRSGIELAREVRAKWPRLPVVLTSGYSHILAAQSGHGFPLLHKPYSVDGLERAFSEALHR